MLNTTGCATPMARDNFLVPSEGLLLGGEAPCSLVIPVYYVFQSFCLAVLLFVALWRSQLWRKRHRKAGVQRKHNSTMRLVSVYLILISSWLSCLVIVLTMIIPLAVGRLDSAMIFLLGLQFFLFNLLAERWLTKLIRLGTKILPKNTHVRIPQSSDEASGDTNDADSKARREDDRLARMDTMLKVGHVLLLVGIVVQLIMLCVLSMIFPETRVYLQIGVGLQGVNVSFGMCTIVWQYQRCMMAIVQTNKKVDDLSPSRARNMSMIVVTGKFRKHQVILVFSGCIACIVFIMWGFRVYEINYATLVVTSLFDAVCNGGASVTFLARSIRTGNTMWNGKARLVNNKAEAPVAIDQKMVIIHEPDPQELDGTSVKAKAATED